MKPEPPRNVRVVLHDGTVIHLELAYVECLEGVHIWRATMPVPEVPHQILAEMIPPHTAIELAGFHA